MPFLSSCVEEKELLKPVKYIGTWKMTSVTGEVHSWFEFDTTLVIEEPISCYMQLDEKGNAVISTQSVLNSDSTEQGTWSVAKNTRNEYISFRSDIGFHNSYGGIVTWLNSSTILVDGWEFCPGDLNWIHVKSCIFSKQ